MMRAVSLVLAAVVCCIGAGGAANAHPRLVLTEDGVRSIRAAEASYPLFERARQRAVRRVDASIAEGVDVPVPRDPGGGFTHERHKENYRIIHDAGVLYQLTGQRHYADHARALLEAYAALYPGLPLHPDRKNQAPGKLFWQSLNEAVWLVYAIQGYDAIVDALDPATRQRLERDLFRPMAEFLSTGSPTTFRKIHNHGTWAAAAVGMTGYALGDAALVDRAILGLDGDGRTGFLAQLDRLFSPDGYYTEGPYYQRYALMPFVLFAQAIDHNQPDRRIFEHRDGILLKAIDTTIQLSYAGKFFPINDAIREKGLDTIELVHGVSIAYGRTGSPGLLSIAQRQGRTVLSGDGLALARAAAEGKAEPYPFTTVLLGDGADGEQGALAILRMGDGEDAQTVVAKNTSQGMGHGHFDKLAYLMYDAGGEVIADYGAARFLNVPSKAGGRYLPENTSWAKQTVAHNTLVVDETSHFDGDWRVAQDHWPDIVYFSAGQDANVVSARMDGAYPATGLSRTLIQLRPAGRSSPIVVDLVRATGTAPARYDLPVYYKGHLVDTDVEATAHATEQRPLGPAAGYQHLWVEAVGAVPAEGSRYTWLSGRRFYSYHALPPSGTQAVFVRTGANDPAFNLRSEPGLMLRAPRATEAVFVSVIEPHGIYDPAAEFTVDSASGIDALSHRSADGRDLISIAFKTGRTVHLLISNRPDPAARHRLSLDGRAWEWAGFFAMVED